MNKAAFGVRGETRPAPDLGPGDVVILDDPSSPESPRAAGALRARGARFLSLPAYPSDPDPIETASPRPKAHLYRIGAGTIDDLWRAIGSVCDLCDLRDCRRYFLAMICARD